VFESADGEAACAMAAEAAAAASAHFGFSLVVFG